MIKTGFLISGYIPTTLGASNAIAMYSSKVIIVNFPDEYTTKRICLSILISNRPKDKTFPLQQKISTEIKKLDIPNM